MKQPRATTLILLLLALAGCGQVTGAAQSVGDSLQSGKTIAIFGAEGRWVGPVTPTDANCGATATGLMSIGSDSFAFDPFESSVSIEGKIKDNHLEGQVTRSAPGQPGVTTRFVADLKHPADDKPVIAGSLVSGRCHWTVALHRG